MSAIRVVVFEKANEEQQHAGVVTTHTKGGWHQVVYVDRATGKKGDSNVRYTRSSET